MGWRAIFRRTAADTWKFAREHVRGVVIGCIVLAVGACVAGAYRAEFSKLAARCGVEIPSDAFQGVWFSVALTLLGAVVCVMGALVVNFIFAPSDIVRDKDAEIDRLRQDVEELRNAADRQAARPRTTEDNIRDRKERQWPRVKKALEALRHRHEPSLPGRRGPTRPNADTLLFEETGERLRDWCGNDVRRAYLNSVPEKGPATDLPSFPPIAQWTGAQRNAYFRWQYFARAIDEWESDRLSEDARNLPPLA